jgi:hypothetical protein
MPIRPENQHRYGPGWPAISWIIRFIRAGSRCECTGYCGRPPVHVADTGRCPNTHGEINLETGARVVLTTAHLDHTPENMHPANLRALCQGCHLHYDRDHHAATRKATREQLLAAAGIVPLPFA